MGDNSVGCDTYHQELPSPGGPLPAATQHHDGRLEAGIHGPRAPSA